MKRSRVFVFDEFDEGPLDTPTAIAPFLLAHAVLCVDCEALYSLPAQRCPRCTSSSFFPLARWLGTNGSPAPGLSAGLPPPHRAAAAARASMPVTRCLAAVLLAGSLVLVAPAGIAGTRDALPGWTSATRETPEFERTAPDRTCADKIATLAIGMTDGSLTGAIAPDSDADDATLGARRIWSARRALMIVAICQPDFGWPLRHAGDTAPGDHPARRPEWTKVY